MHTCHVSRFRRDCPNVGPSNGLPIGFSDIVFFPDLKNFPKNLDRSIYWKLCTLFYYIFVRFTLYFQLEFIFLLKVPRFGSCQAACVKSSDPPGRRMVCRCYHQGE